MSHLMIKSNILSPIRNIVMEKHNIFAPKRKFIMKNDYFPSTFIYNFYVKLSLVMIIEIIEYNIGNLVVLKA